MVTALDAADVSENRRGLRGGLQRVPVPPEEV